MASLISSGDGFFLFIPRFTMVVCSSGRIFPGSMLGIFVDFGNLELLDGGAAFFIGVVGPYREIIGGGVLSISGKLCIRSLGGAWSMVGFVFTVWLDFGKDGAMATCVSLSKIPGAFFAARIAVCSTFVSNLGCELLFSCMASAIIHFLVTLSSLKRLSSSIGRIGTKPCTLVFRSKPQVPYRKIGVSILEIALFRIGLEIVVLYCTKEKYYFSFMILVSHWV